VVLSGTDQIVNAGEVRKYLTGEEDVTDEGEMSRSWEKDGLPPYTTLRSFQRSR
jgi:hypothetical protein